MKQLTPITATTKVLLLCLLCFIANGCRAEAQIEPATTIQISKTHPATIVVPQNGTVAEKAAAQELKHYINLITGANCQIVQESSEADFAGTRIYVGSTQYAEENIDGKSTFGREEWLIKTVDGSVILTGGQPRGVTYAVYHFLEDICGVHWWTPWAESVPQQKVLLIKPLNQRDNPAFRYRDIHKTYAGDNGHFAAHSKLNRQGARAPIDIAYGGSVEYGPPSQVHNFYKYLPPSKYYKEHPNWYNVSVGPKDAFPTVKNSQLCLANPEMRKELLRLLIENIRTSRKTALANGQSPPLIFAISQNDGSSTSLVCEGDKKLAEEQGAASAAVIDFVNYLADGIRDEFPEVVIDTLAYHSGEKAPKSLRPRDNVVIRLTDTQSNVLLPVTAPRNTAFRQNVEEWTEVTDNLRIWDYAVTYHYPQLPAPTLRTYAPNLRLLLEHHVDGLFIEFEYPVEADMRDLKFWVLCKLLEDPSRDPDALVREFTDGFYGAAGTYVRQYLDALHHAVDQTAQESGMPEIDWKAGLAQFTYLTPEFLIQANQIFDNAASAVKKDAVLSRRVRNARSSIDFAIMMRYSQLIQSWVRAGQAPESMPLDRDAAAKRYLQSKNEQIALRLPKDSPNKRLARRGRIVKRRVQNQVDEATSGPIYLPIPEKFNSLPVSKIYTYDYRNTRKTHGSIVEDPDAPSGKVRRFEIPKNKMQKYKLPMPWAIYGKAEKDILGGSNIKPEDVPGSGYNWYKLSNVSPTPTTYLYFMWSWRMQVDIGNVADSRHPDQKVDIWAHLKFEGPLFPYGNPEDENAIMLDRVVIVKK